MGSYIISLPLMAVVLSQGSGVLAQSIQYVTPGIVANDESPSLEFIAKEMNDNAFDVFSFLAMEDPYTKGSFRNVDKYKQGPRIDQRRRRAYGVYEGDEKMEPSQPDDDVIDGALDDEVRDQTIPNAVTFEGLNNVLNQQFTGFRYIPPDTVGDVGKDHYVQATNLGLAVFDKKSGEPLLKTTIYSVFEGFSVTDCSQPAGDPIVLYDQFEERWLLSQFSTGCRSGDAPCYNCIAISTTSSPLSTYHRYAVIAQKDPTIEAENSTRTVFPDYPKYSVWSDSYVLTTRDFSSEGFMLGCSIYLIQKKPMLRGKIPKVAQAVLTWFDPLPIEIVGIVLQPADVDGDMLPPPGSPIPIFSIQEDAAWNFFGVPNTTDALNIFEASVDWKQDLFEVVYVESLAVDTFTASPNCAEESPGGRDGPSQCIPQPGSGTDLNTTSANRQVSYLDTLYYMMFVMHRVAYRNHGTHESIVLTYGTMAVEEPFQSGMRWYEIHRRRKGRYVVKQQSTFAPNDGVHRWMGGIAQDGMGNIALGYSVSSEEVYPGIRYTGRMVDDEPNKMTLGEARIAIGSGVQRGDFISRWGDYSSMNIDPTDDCTFWYTNQYYTIEGELLGLAVVDENNTERATSLYWQTRIGSFTLPGCQAFMKEKKKQQKKREKNMKMMMKRGKKRGWW